MSFFRLPQIFLEFVLRLISLTLLYQVSQVEEKISHEGRLDSINLSKRARRHLK